MSERPLWLSAELEDVAAYICPEHTEGFRNRHELHARYQELVDATGAQEGRRINSLIAAVLSMMLDCRDHQTPFKPQMEFEGGRTPIVDDFTGMENTIFCLAERCTNPFVKSRLFDVAYLLDRKNRIAGLNALVTYEEILADTDLLGDASNASAFSHYEAARYLRRALQLAKTTGWDGDSANKVRQKLKLAREKASKDASTYGVLFHLSEIDLEFRVSDPSSLASDIETALQLYDQPHVQLTSNLWLLASRSYKNARNKSEEQRCVIQAAEAHATSAESIISASGSPSRAAHELSAAIRLLHGISTQKARRARLKHRLIDTQANISDELEDFEHKLDITEIVEYTDKSLINENCLESSYCYRHYTSQEVRSS